MHHVDIQAWASASSHATVHTVVIDGILARNEWFVRIQRPIELHDLSPWSPELVDARRAAAAAHGAAIELAIIVDLWRPGAH